MFSPAYELNVPSPHAPGRRRGGPIHIREVLPAALERASARRGQSAVTGRASERLVAIRLPPFSNAA